MKDCYSYLLPSTIMSANNKLIEDIKEQQEARAKLRESFLRGILALIGEPCNVLSFEHSSHNATFAGWKPDGSDILVRDFETPTGVTMPAALLRCTDVIAVRFSKII